jgi:hypothetical protein
MFRQSGSSANGVKPAYHTAFAKRSNRAPCLGGDRPATSKRIFYEAKINL